MSLLIIIVHHIEVDLKSDPFIYVQIENFGRSDSTLNMCY